MPQALADVTEPVNCLFYGDGGTGKTTHLCHMAALGKILVINAESGVKRRALQARGVHVQNIEVFPGDGETLDYRSLEAEWLRVREALHQDPDAYAGVVWDSLTEIYGILLKDIVEKEFEKAERTNSKRAELGEFFVDRSDYGVMTEQVRRLIRKFRDLPCHFGACALERREVDENDGAVMYRPAVTPALQNDLYLWFDIICHTSVVEDNDDEEQYRGLFKPLGKYRGKDRFQALPKTLVDPTFDRIVSYVEGEVTLDKDPVMKRAKGKVTSANTTKEKVAA